MTCVTDRFYLVDNKGNWLMQDRDASVNSELPFTDN